MRLKLYIKFLIFFKKKTKKQAELKHIRKVKDGHKEGQVETDNLT